MRKLTCMQLQNTCKKAQRNFLQTTRKPEINLIFFFRGFEDFFCVFIDKLSECRIILLTVKVPSSNKRLIFPSILFRTTSDKKP